MEYQLMEHFFMKYGKQRVADYKKDLPTDEIAKELARNAVTQGNTIAEMVANQCHIDLIHPTKHWQHSGYIKNGVWNILQKDTHIPVAITLYFYPDGHEFYYRVNTELILKGLSPQIQKDYIHQYNHQMANIACPDGFEKYLYDDEIINFKTEIIAHNSQQLIEALVHAVRQLLPIYNQLIQVFQK